MLNSNDFKKILDNYDVDDGFNASDALLSLHRAECERLMEIAFKAAREKIESANNDALWNKYEDFQDFKNSLNKTESKV